MLTIECNVRKLLFVIAVLPLMGLVIACIVLPNYANAGLVAYWKCDEGTSTNTSDFSTNRYNGTLNGAVSWVGDHTGEIGRHSLSFNQNNATFVVVPVPAGSSLEIGKASNASFTVAMWIVCNAFNYGEAWCFGDSGNRRLFWQTGSSAGESSYVWSDNYANYHLTTGQAVGAGVWHHITVTSDGTALTLYYDGVAKNTRGTGGQFIGAWTNLFFGKASKDGINQPWNGYIDDVVILDNAASLSDIASIMSGTFTPMLGPWTGIGSGPTNYWTDSTNWASSGQRPGNALVFDGTNGLVSNFNDFSDNTQFKSITFLPAAGEFTLHGNAINLTGNIVNNSTGTETLALAGLVLDGGTRSFNTSSGDIVVSNDISEAQAGNGLVKIGSGTLSLAGTSTYTGATVLSNGTLRLINGGSLESSPVTVCSSSIALAGSGRFGGAVTVQSNGHVVPGLDTNTPGMLSFGAGLSLNAAYLDLKFGDPATPEASDRISITNDLTLAGDSHLTVSHAAGFTFGTYAILTYSGAILGSGRIVPPASNAQYGYQVVTDTVHQIGLRVFLPPAKKMWTGRVGDVDDGTWDIGLTTNWTAGLDSATYNESDDGNDPVVFDDGATGTTSVSLNTTVLPFSVTFSNSAKSYNIGGIGSIAGGAMLTSCGGGGVTLSTSNSFSGDTVVSAGCLTLGNSLALGGSTLNYDNQGGTLSFGTLSSVTLGGLNGSQSLGLTNGLDGAVAMTVGGNNQPTTYSGILSGSGSLIKAGSGNVTLSGTNTYTGTTIVGSGILNATELPDTAGITVNNGTLNVGGYNLSAPLTILPGAAVNVTRTNLNLAAVTNAGTLSFTGSGGSITITGLAGAGTTTFAAGAALGDLLSGTVNFKGSAASITMIGDAIVNLSGTALTVASGSQTSGTISGAGSLIKIGGGTLILNGSNSYTDGTSLNAGVLSSGIGWPGGTLIFNGGILEYTGASSLGPFALNTAMSTDLFKIRVTNPVAGITVIRGGGNYNGTVLVPGSAGTLTLANGFYDDGGDVEVDEGTVVLAGGTWIAAQYANVAYIRDVKPGATVKLGNVSGGQVYYDFSFHMSGGTFDINGQSPDPVPGQNYCVPAIDGSGTIINNVAVPGQHYGWALFKINGTRSFTGNIVDGLGNLGIILRAGGGTWILSGTNTYSGRTEISAGILKAGSTTALSPNSDYWIVGGRTLDLAGYTNSVGSLSRGGIVNLGSGSATLTVGCNNTNAGFDGVIVGTGTVVKVGLGWQSLATTRHVGRTIVKNGELIFTGDSTNMAGTIVDSGILLLRGVPGTNRYTGPVMVNAGGVMTASGVYTGQATINEGGTLLISGASAALTNSSLVVNAGGHLTLADGGASTNTVESMSLAGAEFTFDWIDAAVDTLTTSSNVKSGGNIGIGLNVSGSPSGANLVLIHADGGGLTNANYFLAGNIDYTATLQVTDTDVTITNYMSAALLTNAWWYGGQLTNALNAMALSDGSVGNWCTNSDYAPTPIVPGEVCNVFFSTASNATQQSNIVLGANMTVNSLTFNDTNSVTIAGDGFSLTLNSTNAGVSSALCVNQAATINAAIAGTGSHLVKSGSGSLTLGGTNRFTAQLVISEGTLAVSVINSASENGVLGNSTNAVTLGYANGLIGTLKYTGADDGVTDKGFTLAEGGAGAFQIDSTSLTITGIVGGSGNLVKTGVGSLNLSAANSFTGNTLIAAGVLNVSQACISPGSDIHLKTGAMLGLEFSGTNAIRYLIIDEKIQAQGTWGSSASGAEYVNDLFFVGMGKLLITAGPDLHGTTVIVR